MSLAQDILIKTGIISKPAPAPAPIKKKRAEPAKFKPILPGQRRERWTPEEDSVLERLVETHTPEQTALEMKRSCQAVRKRANRIGLEFKKLRSAGYNHWTPEMIAKLRELYDQRNPMLSSPQIGKIMGINQSQVRGIACYLGLSGRKHQWTLTEEIIVAKHFDKAGAKLIGEVLGIKESSVAARHLRLVNQRMKTGRAEVVLSRDVVAEYLLAHDINK